MNKKCGMLNGQWGKTPAPTLRIRLPHSPFPLPHSARAAVTLIELLIGMVIVAILAAAILGAAAAAMEAGRRSRTQSTITKIHNLIMDRYAEYETRRIELKDKSPQGKGLAEARLNGLRELMKYEMPDRWSDVTGVAVPGGAANPISLASRPALAMAYERRLREMIENGKSADDITRFQGAECLYLTVMHATGDGEARTLFREQEIGDVDGDGALEILDGWGRPISWLRWPAGFVSDLQPADPVNDHDPFDVYRVYDTAYRLVPLIYSTGPDGASGINSKVDSYVAPLDPYFPGTGTPVGTVENRNESLDNITNHLIKY